jgi:hypothetical protein
MAGPLPRGLAPRLVTFESLRLPLSRGMAVEAAAAGPRLAAARFEHMKERLRQAAADVGPDVMITVRSREVSRLQSELARRAVAGRTLRAGGVEVKFGTGFEGRDWFGWLLSLLDWVDRADAHPIRRPATAEADAIPDRARIAMAGDWGTGLYGAPRIAERIRATGPFDILMHLGDVYYSGTIEEVQERFIDVWPFDAGRRTRALNSNHEMYSGGYGYFGLLLPHVDQAASYFAFQNSHWLLVGLDSAHSDHDLDSEQIAWLDLVIAGAQRAGGRAKKLVLFSHHQLFSAFDDHGTKLEQALRHLLERGAITAWYWGHEHRAAIYDAHPRYGLLGRCLGNGGIPEPRSVPIRNAPVEKRAAHVVWKRVAAAGNRPSCLVLDGSNPDIPGEEERFGPHGYMTLELDGPALVERVFLSDGTEVLSHTIV